MRNKSLLKLGVFALVASLLGLGAKYVADRSAWSDVQAALYRVDSGIQYESIIALRSHLADADAIVRTFESSLRFYPTDYPERARLARLAISYLGLATEFQTDNVSSDTLTSNAQYFAKLAQAPDVSTFVPRTCRYGYLAFDLNAAASAALRLGEATLKRAEGEPLRTGDTLKPTGGFGPLNFDAESNACKLQEQTR